MISFLSDLSPDFSLVFLIILLPILFILYLGIKKLIYKGDSNQKVPVVVDENANKNLRKIIDIEIIFVCVLSILNILYTILTVTSVYVGSAIALIIFVPIIIIVAISCVILLSKSKKTLTIVNLTKWQKIQVIISMILSIVMVMLWFYIIIRL